MSHNCHLLDTSEEIVLLQQLEMYKQQKIEFPPDIEQFYTKLVWRKVLSKILKNYVQKMRDHGMPVFNIDCEIETLIQKTRKRDQVIYNP